MTSALWEGDETEREFANLNRKIHAHSMGDISTYQPLSDAEWGNEKVRIMEFRLHHAAGELDRLHRKVKESQTKVDEWAIERRSWLARLVS